MLAKDANELAHPFTCSTEMDTETRFGGLGTDGTVLRRAWSRPTRPWHRSTSTYCGGSARRAAGDRVPGRVAGRRTTGCLLQHYSGRVSSSATSCWLNQTEEKESTATTGRTPPLIEAGAASTAWIACLFLGQAEHDDLYAGQFGHQPMWRARRHNPATSGPGRTSTARWCL
jgi:hypothetical protein